MRQNKEKEHDPEKLADFSGKIMRQNKEKEHDPEKLADFSGKIMRPDKEKESAIESTQSNRALVFPSLTVRSRTIREGNTN